jgi:hypothetical protein
LRKVTTSWLRPLPITFRSASGIVTTISGEIE